MSPAAAALCNDEAVADHCHFGPPRWTARNQKED